MRLIEKQQIEGEARHIEGVDLVDCLIRGEMRRPKRPGDWNRIRDCRAKRCRHDNARIAGTAIQRCEIDGLGRVGPLGLGLSGCVFEQVRLRGNFTRLDFDPVINRFDFSDPSTKLKDETRDAWTAAIREFYVDADWVLDITEAQFSSRPGLAAVPGDLVRFDPSRQARVQREALMRALADKPILDLPMWPDLQSFLEETPFDNVIVTTSSRKGQRERDLEDIGKLRDLGIADTA